MYVCMFYVHIYIYMHKVWYEEDDAIVTIGKTTKEFIMFNL